MKLANWELPSIFSSPKSRELDQYIQGSLASSSTLSKNLANWASSYDPRARLRVMKFHKEWKNPGCDMMKWYGMQTCPKFRSIQHWRHLDTHFYHEFLIILLTDGSACRVERMGEGAQADAIRSSGCTAYDLIQWFSFDDYTANKWVHGSQEMIVQVDFPCTFDLLDVLAVCYTIQHKTPQASVYTLQRYNCYFLCNTVLAILTRRVGDWEALITDEDWPTVVHGVMEDLKCQSVLPIRQQDPIYFLALGICSLLYPGSPNPADVLLAPFQEELEKRGRDAVNQVLGKMLWYSHVNAAIHSGLWILYHTFPDSVLNGLSSNSDTFNLFTLLNEVDRERFPPTGLDLPSIHNKMSKEFLALCSYKAQTMTEIFKRHLRVHELEKKPRLSRRCASSMAGLVAVTIPRPLVEYALRDVALNQPQDRRRVFDRFGVTMAQAAAALPSTTMFNFVKILTRAEEILAQIEAFNANTRDNFKEPYWDYPQDYTYESDLAKRFYEVIMEVLQPELETPKVPAALALLNTYFPRAFWKFCFLHRLTEISKHDFRDLLTRKANILQTQSSQMGGTQMPSVSTVEVLQTHIQQRIQCHAERVESFQLGDSHLVRQDIEWTISAVWAGLPLERKG